MSEPQCETRIAVAVVEHEGRFLVGRRPPGSKLAGYAEFPGGKLEPHETPAEAAARECLEETGIAVAVFAPYPEAVHEYPHGLLRISFFACRPLSADPTPSAPFRWLTRAELAGEQFPPANDALLRLLLSEPHSSP